MDESWIKIRNLIWGMCLKLNPPSIWLTINPADTHDPITHVLCSSDINLDKFIAPDHFLPDVAIASDPYSLEKNFHVMIQAVLECLLGLKSFKQHEQVKREKGILGVVEGHVGTVEAQGRGTLHLHMLLWLHGAPSSNEMKDLLSSDSFRSKASHFISRNI